VRLRAIGSGRISRVRGAGVSLVGAGAGVATPRRDWRRARVRSAS